jgi:hypothetical protein
MTVLARPNSNCNCRTILLSWTKPHNKKQNSLNIIFIEEKEKIVDVPR